MVKQATKGQKEIYEENKSTIHAYAIACVASIGLYIALSIFLFESSTYDYVFFGISFFLQAATLFVMKSMAASRKDDRGHVVDAGMDLNDPTAFGEYCKDTIILTVIAQIISLYSVYGFLILLALPAAVTYKVMVSFILPWVFAPAPEGEQDDDRKNKKKDKREKIVYKKY